MPLQAQATAAGFSRRRPRQPSPRPNAGRAPPARRKPYTRRDSLSRRRAAAASRRTKQMPRECRPQPSTAAEPGGSARIRSAWFRLSPPEQRHPALFLVPLPPPARFGLPKPPQQHSPPQRRATGSAQRRRRKSCISDVLPHAAYHSPPFPVQYIQESEISFKPLHGGSMVPGAQNGSGMQGLMRSPALRNGGWPHRRLFSAPHPIRKRRTLPAPPPLFPLPMKHRAGVPPAFFRR